MEKIDPRDKRFMMLIKESISLVNESLSPYICTFMGVTLYVETPVIGVGLWFSAV